MYVCIRTFMSFMSGKHCLRRVVALHSIIIFDCWFPIPFMSRLTKAISPCSLFIVGYFVSSHMENDC